MGEGPLDPPSAWEWDAGPLSVPSLFCFSFLKPHVPVLLFFSPVSLFVNLNRPLHHVARSAAHPSLLPSFPPHFLLCFSPQSLSLE